MRRLSAALIATALSLPATAQAEGFHPTETCLTVLQRATDTDRVLLAAWVIGYLNKQNEAPSLVRLDNARVVLENVTGYCTNNPNASILDMVTASQRSSPDLPGSPAHARAFLHQFLDPAANRAALTAKLRPTTDEIRAVYASPLSETLIAMYNEMFKPGVAIGPNDGQTEVLLWGATTNALRVGAPALEEFPGGYKDVRDMMQGDYPIFRFKFVEPGERIGMAFDGLIYINDRYVLMPKPWRAMQ